MAIPELQQASSLLNRATNVLLIVPEKPSLDAFASMVALYLALQASKDNHVDEVSPSHVPKALQFLPGSSQIRMAPQHQPDVILDIAGPTAMAEIRQELLSGGLRLHIMFADTLTINKDKLETSVRQLPYDVVVVFGAADLEELGQTFTAHADFFYNTPIINIDHRPDNEHFGTVNIVDITASSVAEVTYDVIMQLAPELDADIATALYAGIVAGTDSFQRPSTTPRSFKVAAELMERKADRETVITQLVKTKPLSLLKLAGRLYARLRYDEHLRLFWSVLRTVDFQESGATMDDVAAAMKELTNNIANYNAVYILYEHDGQFELYLLLGKGLQKRRGEIQTSLGAQRDNGLLRLMISADSLAAAEKTAAEKVRGILP